MPRTIDLRNEPRREPDLDPRHELPPPDEELIAHSPNADEDETQDREELEANSLFAWEAPDFEEYPDRAIALWVSAGVLVAIAVGALFLKNYAFALLLFIASGLTVGVIYRKPRMLTVSVDADGIRIGQKIYNHDDLKSFWVSYEPPLFKELLLVSNKSLMPLLRIPLGDVDPVELRTTLKSLLREERYQETLIDILAKRMGF